VGGTLGAIGSGMGFALGAQLARPGHPVIAVVGDGSAMMTVQALWTAVASRIPVVFVICNNASYRILKLNLDVYRDLEGRGGRRQRYHPAFDFAVPFDMAAIARAFGMPGVRIEDPEQIGPELGKALASGGPALLDVIIDGTVR
jgi:benzoylformate decarboxylase